MINPRNLIFIKNISEEIPEEDIYFISYENKESFIEGITEEALEKNQEVNFKKNLKVEDFLKCLYLIENIEYIYDSDKNAIINSSTKKELSHVQILLPIAIAIVVDEDGPKQINFGENLSNKIRSQLKLETY